MNIKSIINEELQNLNEDLNKISLQSAIDHKMFGPVYHGTTEDNRSNIEQHGFKIFVGTNGGENIRHGYPEQIYAHGAPPPIHHLGYGIYFTTVKTIAKKFNVNSGKGLKTYYLNIPRLETINLASPKKMMDWWIANGYDIELAKQSQQGRIDATLKLTENLKQKYDAVWFKGKTMYSVLDGDQIVVFNPENIYQIDTTLAGELEIGSKVRRTNDKFEYKYSYDTNTGKQDRILSEVPSIPKGTIGTIVSKMPTENLQQSWQKNNNTPHWTTGSNFMYRIKWNKGGTESNALDKDIEPFKNKNINEIISEELQNLFEGIEVFHGSTEKFDTFDMQKVGTGDGKSLGGWGIYFSDNPDVSKRYYLPSGQLKQHEIRNGNYFDLDAPLDDGQRILSALQRQGVDENNLEEFQTDYIDNDVNNKQAYDWLSYVLGSEKQASLFLKSLGYIGNTMKDRWDNARNYVVFDTQTIIN